MGNLIDRAVKEATPVNPRTNSLYDVPYLSTSAKKDLISFIASTETSGDIEVPLEIQADLDTFYKGEDGTYDNLIPFLNGVYNIETGQLLKFTPYIFLTTRLQVNFTEHSYENTKASAAFERLFPNKDTRNCVIRMIGYTIYAKRLSKENPCLFIIYGSGGTGKSTVQEMITKILGPKNVSHLDLSQITSKFGTCLMDGKLANFCGDASTKNHKETLIEGGTLKLLAEGQVVSVEPKGKPGYDMIPKAKLWFLGNTQPDLGAVDSGLFRRLYIVKLGKKFSPTDTLYKDLTCKESIQWLARASLDAYIDLLATGLDFAPSKEMLVERNYYSRTNNVYAFLIDFTGEEDPAVAAQKLDGMITKEVYAAYKNFCMENGVRNYLGSNKFYSTIRTEFNMNTKKAHVAKLDGMDTTTLIFTKG
jgi:putative DNA primase/helicase